MYIILIFGLICVLLTYLDSKGKISNGLSLSFVILGILYALHYDFGTDFWNYHRYFREVGQYRYIENCFNNLEFGWDLLYYVMQPFGFQSISILLGAIINYSVYYFIKNYIPKKNRVFAVFLYVFTYSLYVMSFSMMRQSLVMALFLFNWQFISTKRFVPAVIITAVSISIHTSAFILVPFLFWGFLPTKYNKAVSIGMLLLYLALFTQIDILQSVLNYFLTIDNIGEYILGRSQLDGADGFGLGFICINVPFLVFLALLYRNRIAYEYRSLIFLWCLSYLLTPFAKLNTLIIRITLYFTIFSIAAIPLVYSSVNNKLVRRVVYLITIFITMYTYFGFFSDNLKTSPTNFYEYRSILNL